MVVPSYLFALLVFYVLLEYLGNRKLEAAAMLIGVVSFLAIIAKQNQKGGIFLILEAYWV